MNNREAGDLSRPGNQYELIFKYIKYCLYKDGIMNIETADCYWCGQRAKFCNVNYLADQVVPEAG